MIIIHKHLEVYGNITKMSQIITESFKSEVKIIGNTPNNCKAAVSWKCGHCSACASLKIWIITHKH